MGKKVGKLFCPGARSILVVSLMICRWRMIRLGCSCGVETDGRKEGGGRIERERGEGLVGVEGRWMIWVIYIST